MKVYEQAALTAAVGAALGELSPDCPPSGLRYMGGQYVFNLGAAGEGYAFLTSNPAPTVMLSLTPPGAYRATSVPLSECGTALVEQVLTLLGAQV